MGFKVLDASGNLKVVGTIGPTGPTGPTGASGGGGGAAIVEGAFSTRSATGPSGTVFLPTDGYSAGYYDATGWVGFGPLHYLGPAPVDPGTWVNQGTASISAASGALTLIGGTGVTTTNLVARVVNAGAAPWTVTAFFRGFMLIRATHQMGLCFRESASGKIVNFGLYADGGTGSTGGNLWWVVDKYNNATGATGAYFETPSALQPTNGLWLRIADDNTNRICSISVDGQHWTQYHSVARTDFITADQWGIYVGTQTSTGTTIAPTMQVLALTKT